MTPADIFKEMPNQVDANAAKGVNATIQFNPVSYTHLTLPTILLV